MSIFNKVLETDMVTRTIPWTNWNCGTTLKKPFQYTYIHYTVTLNKIKNKYIYKQLSSM